MKKIFLFFFLATLVVLSIWFFFIQETYRNPLAQVSPLDAIPATAPIVLSFDDFFQLRHHIAKMPFADEMSDVFFVKKMSEDFNSIRNLFSKNKNHRQLLLDSRITSSLHLSGKDDIDFLYVIDDKEDVFSLEDLLEIFPYKKSQAHRNTVYTLTLKDGGKFTIASYNNLLLVSRYAYLVETGMQQIKNPKTNLRNNNVLKVSNKNDNTSNQVEVLVLFENFKAFAAPFLNPKPVAQLNYFSKLVTSVKWILEFKEEGIKIDGNLKPNGNGDLFNQYFDNNKITNSSAQDILPSNIAYFFRHSIKGKNQIEAETLKNVFDQFFQPWIANEWLTGRTKIFTRKMKSEKFVAYEMNDMNMTQYHLAKLADSVGLLKEWEYQTYPIRQILLEALPIPFSEGEKINIKNPCYTFIENYVVFAQSPRIIEKWIDQILVNKTLARNITFLKMKNQSTSSDVTEFYWNQKSAERFFRNSISIKGNRSIDQINYWKNFTLGVNGQWKNNQLLHHGFLFYEKTTTEEVDIKWRIPLHAEAITQPFALFNEEKESHDILIQDKDNRLYLFNSEGEEEWNLLLEGPILSKIVAGNFIKDQSTIIMFNTKDKIYQIDFEGENKNNFPIELASKAANGLLLADFSEDEYGVFLACENGNLYGFDMLGIPFSGWQGIEGVGKVTTPMKHFQTTNKDYLIVFNDKGDIFSFGKNGFKTTQGLGIATSRINPLCLQVQQDGKEILIADPSGYQRTIDLEGEELGMLQKNPPKEVSNLYASADIGGDNQTDFVVLENNLLQIYFNHKNEFEQFGSFKFLDTPDLIFPIQSQNMGKAMIGSVNQKQEQIFLIDKKGNLHQDFPLAGTTPFELVNLFSENKKVVLVAVKDQVIAYELP